MYSRDKINKAIEEQDLDQLGLIFAEIPEQDRKSFATSSLKQAILSGNATLVELLLCYGADVWMLDEKIMDYLQPESFQVKYLLELAMTTRQLPLLKRLVAEGAFIDLVDPTTNENPLFYCILDDMENEDIQIRTFAQESLIYLLQQGMDVNEELFSDVSKILSNTSYSLVQCTDNNNQPVFRLADADGKALEKFHFANRYQKAKNYAVPEDQSWLIEHLKILDYPDNKDGLCFGLAAMVQQAILANDVATLKRRLLILSNMSPEQLIDNIKALKQKKLEWLKKEKQRFKQLPEEVKIQLEKSERIQNQLAVIKQETSYEIVKDFYIYHKRKKLSAIADKDYELRKNILLYNEFVNQRLRNFFTSDEIILMEIPAFFDGIQLHFSPSEYAEIIGYHTLQNIEVTSSILQPLALEKKGSLSPVTQFYGIYNAQEWQKLLNQLQKIINNVKPRFNTPFSLFIGGYRHRITVGYTLEEGFIFADPNTMMKVFNEFDAANIIDAFSVNEFSAATTTIYCNENDKSIIEAIMQEWLQDPIFKSIHEVNAENVQRRDSRNQTLLHLAVKNLDALTTAQCLQLGADPNQLIYNINLLCNAVYDNSIEIVNLLLAAGANPLQRMNNFPGYTPLLEAISVNKIEMIIMMINYLIPDKKQYAFLSELSDAEIAGKLIKMNELDTTFFIKLDTHFIYALEQACTRALYLDKEVTNKAKAQYQPAAINYYEILEVARSASSVEIKKAYYKLSLRYHPDKNSNNQDAIEKFQLINQAYQILSDEIKRRKYDKTLGKSAAAKPQSFFKLSTIMFKELKNSELDKKLNDKNMTTLSL